MELPCEVTRFVQGDGESLAPVRVGTQIGRVEGKN
jgi:hypothetical protein